MRDPVIILQNGVSYERGTADRLILRFPELLNPSGHNYVPNTALRTFIEGLVMFGLVAYEQEPLADALVEDEFQDAEAENASDSFLDDEPEPPSEETS